MSVESQGREIDELIRKDGLVCVRTFTDKVESGKSDKRPAFQEMMALARSKDHDFGYIYCYDTARFSRNAEHACFYKRDLAKAGVQLRYVKISVDDSATGKFIEGIFEHLDQLHSRKSKEDGCRGMKQNVLNGYRAGGRALYGYRLEYELTGRNSDGPVYKSKLVPHPDEFSRIRQYLEGRLRGETRMSLAKRLGIPLNTRRLLYIEQSAHTYAGCTVWNKHNERIDGQYVGDRKYRPRSEWVVNEGTHEAAITFAEAELVFGQAMERKARFAKTYRRGYLLSNLLRCKCGGSMVGNAGYYRCRNACGGSSVKQERAEEGVMRILFEHLLTETLYDKVLEIARRKMVANRVSDDQVKVLKRQITAIEGKQSRLTDLLAESAENRPLLAKLGELESERGRLLVEFDKAQADDKSSQEIGEARLDLFLACVRKQMEEGDGEQKKALVRNLLQEIRFTGKEMNIFARIPGQKGENTLLSPRSRPQGYSGLNHANQSCAD